MSKYQLVIFDWEGTLCDCVGRVFNQLNHVAESLGFAPFDKDKARSLLHQDFDLIISELYQGYPMHQLLALKTKFRQHYTLHIDDVLLYQGVESLLASLSDEGKILAIATGKSEQSLAKALEETGLKQYFAETRSPQQCSCKPAPDMIDDIVLATGIDKEATVMVGDSSVDIDAAMNAKVDAIGINISGMADVEVLTKCGALDVVDNYQDLLTHLH